ncbi:hypothetical protein L202_08270 [Cryptococcus amylolentus CBS 6039]|uniref:Uncharacterized protein n=1 Tax=Cryptococcus amylolentus CBS 6039 TaxID=1295533 RepID=A0A1E3H925_9TREE|nr:hypothetical protein L202_08270 [Cryptococcus amylolentus CBS 6039]ODN72838.1 hypothetical protein L202_08270 [Cryptococcus amylolentus CBS 6039]
MILTALHRAVGRECCSSPSDDETDDADDVSSCDSETCTSSSASSAHGSTSTASHLQSNQSPTPTLEPSHTKYPPMTYRYTSMRGPTLHLFTHTYLTSGLRPGTFRLCASYGVGLTPSAYPPSRNISLEDDTPTTMPPPSRRIYLIYHIARLLLQQGIDGFFGHDGTMVDSKAEGQRRLIDMKSVLGWMVYDLAKCLEQLLEPGFYIRSWACVDRQHFDCIASDFWGLPMVKKYAGKQVQIGKRFVAREMEQATEAPVRIKRIYTNVFA